LARFLHRDLDATIAKAATDFCTSQTKHLAWSGWKQTSSIQQKKGTKVAKHAAWSNPAC
jgi:hypothetical protein